MAWNGVIMKIYADNAATTKMSKRAIDAMLPFMGTLYGNASSLHTDGQRAAEALLSAIMPPACNTVPKVSCTASIA